MKRIILLLALLSLGVSKAQIVGGYLPLNSTKTATMGGLKVAGNETVTGTFSVGSTATITGALKASSTMSLGSANLTGGNTGTVAVLSDAVFPVQFFPSSFSPADGTTYYIGQSLWDWTWTATTGRVYLPYNCTLVGATIVQKVLSVTGTAESVTVSVRANNTTDYTLTTTETFSATNKESNITGLSHSLNANDAINVKIVCPTFATNPTNIYLGIVLWFVRRS